LIEVALCENVDQRYGKVVIASGDHIFAEAASTLVALGVEVTVFSRAVYLSRFLRETEAKIQVFSAADFSLAA
jgi:pyruvate/2-oxoglutarate dehydrogenase complex dihydrolipoamide dehydrogenase (E3) component